MKTYRLTYMVHAIENPFSQKTCSAIVSNNNNIFNDFEEAIRDRFSKDNCKISFNHTGKIVTLDYSCKN